MANRENQLHRDHAGGAAQGLCLRHFPDGRERRRPGALLDRAGACAASFRSTTFHVPARLARTVRTTPLHRRVDRDFDAVIDGCAEPQARPRPHLDQRPHPQASTARSIELGHCHTVEVYDGDGTGRRALRRLARPRLLRREHVPPRARRLEDRAGASGRAAEAGGYRLLDTQFVTDHLKIFGAVEVPQAAVSPAARRGARRRSRFRRAADRPPGAAARKRWRSSTDTNGGSAT